MGKNPIAREVVSTIGPNLKDERSAHLALDLLDIDEGLAKEEVLSQVRQKAEALWAYRIGSGYENTGAEESRRSLVESIPKYPNKIPNLSNAERLQLEADLGMFLKSSKFPPDIEITQDLGGFHDKAAEAIDSINARYEDFVADYGPLVAAQGKASDFNRQNVEQDTRTLDQSWNDYVSDYKQANGGQLPPEDEVLAYRDLRQELVDREHEVIEKQEEKTKETMSEMSEELRYPEVPNSISLTRKEAIELSTRSYWHHRV